MTNDDFSAARKVFDNSANNYSETIEEYFGGIANHDFFVQNKFEILSEKIASLNIGDKKANILDVGCGIGLIDTYLKKLNIELHGADISEASIAQAQKTNPEVNYKVYDGSILPYENGSFDLSFAIGVMHHVPPAHWQNVIKEMKRVTRDGGVIIIIEHNPLNIGTQWVVKRCPLDKGVVMLTQWKTKSLCAQAGLKNITAHNIVFTPFKASFFRKLDKLLYWLPLGTQYYVSATVNDKNT